jgi:NitT/TauT family transport system ATP-binding protein
MNEILTLQNVSLAYHTKQGETLAINNLSFSVKESEFIAIIGPSGCGKTTVLSLIAGLIKPSSGKLFLRGEEIVKPESNLGYMLQKDHLFPWRTIEKNLYLPLEIKNICTDINKKYALSLAAKYGLNEFINYYPYQLSGGMKQRAALIRTLVHKPEILLLDEPFSALDYQTRLSVCDDVYNIIKTEKKTAILVTHDISEAISLADRIIVLSKRPANIINIHNINLSEYKSPLKRREHPDFAKWFEKLWKELNL